VSQVRYALTAVGNGEKCLDIKAKNGRIIAAEKNITSVKVGESSIHKLVALSYNLGVTYSGIGQDFQAILLKARKYVQIYHCKF
jgi:20S proteasome subunit alpha 2